MGGYKNWATSKEAKLNVNQQFHYPDTISHAHDRIKQGFPTVLGISTNGWVGDHYVVASKYFKNYSGTQQSYVNYGYSGTASDQWIGTSLLFYSGSAVP